MDCSMPGFPVLHHLLGRAQTSRPLSRWCHPAISSSVTPFSSCPQSFPASGFFPRESALCIRWPKYWSFSFSISPSNEYSRLISFRIDWFDLLAVQGTLKSLLQHHGLKASILWCSAFLMVQLSHLYMTTIALTIQTSVSKVMSQLFNTLSRFVIAFLPRSKHLLISWMESPSAMILEPKRVLSYSSCDEMHGQLQRLLWFPGTLLLNEFGTDCVILVHALQMRKLRAEKRPGCNSKRQSEPELGSFWHVFTGCFNLYGRIAPKVCSPKDHVVSVWPVRSSQSEKWGDSPKFTRQDLAQAFFPPQSSMWLAVGQWSPDKWHQGDF